MNTSVAARQCRPLVNKASNLPDQHPEYGKNHLHRMIDRIEHEQVSGEQAHRWLGWLQCALVMGGAATLEQMKKINKNA